MVLAGGATSTHDQEFVGAAGAAGAATGWTGALGAAIGSIGAAGAAIGGIGAMIG